MVNSKVKARVFRIKPKKLKRAKPADLKSIARKLSQTSWVDQEAKILGFQLTEIQVKEIQRRIEIRVKRQNTLAIKTAKKTFEEAIRAVKSKCLCGEENLKAKTASHHHAAPGPIVIGPGGHLGFTSNEIVFLYCPSCGLTYYNEEVQKLSERFARGDFEPKLQRLSSGHLMTDPMISFRGS